MKKKGKPKLTMSKEIVIRLTIRPEMLRMVHFPNTSTYDETCFGGVSDFVCVAAAKPARKRKK